MRTAQIDKIKYGAEADANERIQVQHLQLGLRLPMEFIPDPRVLIEDEKDMMRNERENQLAIQRKEEENANREAMKIAKK